MFTNFDFRGVARGPCSVSNCECDGYARSQSSEVCTSQNATLQCGWCCYCSHPPVSHSRIDGMDCSQVEPAHISLEAAQPLSSLPFSIDGVESLLEQPVSDDAPAVEAENVKTEPGMVSREILQPRLGQVVASKRRAQNMFAAVRFLKDKSVAVVPVDWIDGSKCLWPHLLAPQDIAEAAEHADIPDSSFMRRNIHILRIESSYDKARTWLAEQDADKVEASTDKGVSHSKYPRIALSGGRGEEHRLKDLPHKQSSSGKTAQGVTSTPRNKALNIQPTVRLHRLAGYDRCSQQMDTVVEGSHTAGNAREEDSQSCRSPSILNVCKSRIVACSESESVQSPESVDDSSTTLSKDTSPRLEENVDRCSRKSIWNFEAVESVELEEADKTANSSSLEEQDIASMILRELKTIKQQNEQILAALGVPNQNKNMELGKMKLPVADIDSLDALELKLATDPVFRACLTHQLSLVGGSNLRAFVAGVLRFLFSDAVGQQFSMLGQRKKRRLKDMVIYSVIEQAIRSNSTYDNATSYAIRIAAGSWLKNCASRMMAAKKKLGEDPNDSSSCD
ncbi:uncharacterized protein [Dermacentor albipictus]|uniref:uncharacterized protein isoform X2 n=1 Tax=Dermacentor albipictus TaxID=60249 RepID=UPI0031FC00A7